MRRTGLGVVLLVLGSLALGAEGVVKPVACAPDLAMDRYPLSVYERDFFKPAEPNGTVNPHAVVAMFRGQMVVAVAIDSEKPDAKTPDVVRFDFTGKGQFAGAPVAPLKATGNEQGTFSASFGPTTLEAKRDGKSIPVSVRGNYNKSPDYRWMSLDLGTALEGRVAFGDKTYAVRVIDGNNDLACGAKATANRAGGSVRGIQPGDTLAIDTGDGSFGPKAVRAYYGQPVRVDGAWYDVALSPDGTKIAASRSAAEPGKLKIAHERWSAKLAGEKYIILLDGSTEPVELPADRYTVAEFRQFIPSDPPGDKGAWKGSLISGRSDLRDGKGKTFEAAAGKTAELAIGAPLKASVAASVRASAVGMDFVLTDAAGLRAELSLPEAGTPTPEVEVFDAGGKLVHEGKFQFG